MLWNVDTVHLGVWAVNPTENAIYVLEGIEDNKLDHEKVAKYIMDLDPVIVYFILRVLREKYPASNPASTGVLERLVNVLNTHPEVLKRSRAGEKDAVTEWFLESYELRSYFSKTEELFQMLNDKIDG